MSTAQEFADAYLAVVRTEGPDIMRSVATMTDPRLWEIEDEILDEARAAGIELDVETRVQIVTLDRILREAARIARDTCREDLNLGPR